MSSNELDVAIVEASATITAAYLDKSNIAGGVTDGLPGGREQQVEATGMIMGKFAAQVVKQIRDELSGR